MNNSENKNKTDIFYKIAIMTDPIKSPLAIGTPIIPLNYIINIQKAGTIIIMYILMLYFLFFYIYYWIISYGMY